jgi:hypothetical protein
MLDGSSFTAPSAMHESSTRREPLRFVGEHEGSLRVWAWLNVEIAHWYGKPTGPAARTLWHMTDQILAELGSTTKLSFVHLVANKIALPDAETRSVLVEASKTHEERSALCAIMLNGTGFWASAFRGFATSITLLIPKTMQVRVCGSPAELVPWFPSEHGRRTGVSLDPETLVSVLAQAKLQHLPDTATCELNCSGRTACRAKQAC